MIGWGVLAGGIMDHFIGSGDVFPQTIEGAGDSVYYDYEEHRGRFCVLIECGEKEE